MIVVVPPQAGARVPVSKVSEAAVPPKGSSMWVCASMPPGMTYLPVASTTASTLPSRSTPSSDDPGARTAAMVSPSTSTSAVAVPAALTTVPPLISVVLTRCAPSCSGPASSGNRSHTAAPTAGNLQFLTGFPKETRSSWLGDGDVGVGAPVAVKLPGVTDLTDHVHVQVADNHFLGLFAAQRPHQAAGRVDELAGAVEVHRQVAVLVVLGAHPVGGGHEVAVRRGGRRLLDLPQPLRQSGLGRVGVEHDLCAVQPQLAPALGEVPVVADVDPDRPDRGPEHRITQVPGPEVELLPELLQVGQVVLAVLAEDGAVGVHHHRGVVVDAGDVLLVDRQDHDHRQLGGQRREPLHDRPVCRLRQVVVLGVLGDAEVRPVEQLLEADDLGALSLGVPGELLVLVQHRGDVAGPGGLGDGCSDDGHRTPPPRRTRGATETNYLTSSSDSCAVSASSAGSTVPPGSPGSSSIVSEPYSSGSVGAPVSSPSTGWELSNVGVDMLNSIAAVRLGALLGGNERPPLVRQPNPRPYAPGGQRADRRLDGGRGPAAGPGRPRPRLQRPHLQPHPVPVHPG